MDIRRIFGIVLATNSVTVIFRTLSLVQNNFSQFYDNECAH